MAGHGGPQVQVEPAEGGGYGAEPPDRKAADPAGGPADHHAPVGIHRAVQRVTANRECGQVRSDRGARLLVVNLATGAERDWVLPGIGWIGGTKPAPRTVSWADDSRTLLFEVHHGIGGPIARLRLLDTTAPSGSLTAASKAVPIPSGDISGHVEHPPLALGGAFAARR